MTANQTTLKYGHLVYLAALAFIFSGNLLQAVEDDLDIINAPATRLRPHISNEVMVVLKGKDAVLNSSAFSGRIINRYVAGNKTILRVKLAAGTSVEKAIAENWAARDGRILRVEPNYKVCALGLPNDSYFNYLWGLHNTGQTGGNANCDIQASEAWNVTTGSYNVIVAVIDSGVSFEHPDLVNQKWVNTDEIADNGIDDDHNGYVDDCFGWDFYRNNNNPEDEHGHGTHVAGTIAAEGNNDMGVCGVAWKCRIMPCRFLSAEGSGSVADAVEAINYAVANGARVLNNSWGGGGYSASLKAAIENAANHGVLFVASAGNSSQDNDLYASYPANYDVSNVISVAATNYADNLGSFSCYGKNTVHLAAPGVNILSTYPGGYAWMSGTSMASPHVSGAAALLLSVEPAMGLAELKNRLIWCGDSLPALQNRTITGCRLNVYGALAAQDCISVLEPAAGTHWVTGCSYDIKWISVGAAASVSIYLEKAGQVVYTIAQQTQNDGVYQWTVPANLANASDYTIRVTDGAFESQSGLILINDQRTRYHTEWFYNRTCDLRNKSVLFVPDGFGDYLALTQQITALPTSVTGSTLLTLRDDDALRVDLAAPVSFYGAGYNRLYIGSNGYITFDRADAEYRSTLSYHFAIKRLSVFFQDLNPVSGGRICYKELPDRFVVTWVNVPAYNAPTAVSTFQAELYHDGRIRMSWLKLAWVNPVVGFSRGNGVPADYQDEDLSACDSYQTQIESISISGPRAVFENSSVALSCTGTDAYGDASTIGNQFVQWTASDPVASISANGLLRVGSVNLFKHVDITGQFDGTAAALSLCVKDANTQNINIRNCSVTAGTVDGYDSLALLGKLSISPATIASSNAIVVKVWTADNTCVYSRSFDRISRFFVNNVYRRTIRSDIQSHVLRLDPATRTVSLGAVNIDLSENAVPAYFTLECGNYRGLGIIN